MNGLIYNDSDKCVSSVVELLGNKITIATPLGIGKPIQLLNAFYRYAKRNPNIQLKIFTALSLIQPTVTGELLKRFIDPILERRYGNDPALEYEFDRRTKNLPKNVQILEFYLTPGQYINNDLAQQDFICSNYTHVVRDLLYHDVNVILQLISRRDDNSFNYSLSCNTDLTLDLITAFETSSEIKQKPLLLGEVNQYLPYMYGEFAEVNEKKFYAFLDSHSTPLFSIPRPPISKQDFMIGLYTSALIKDNACLQVGIGRLSEALIYSLILRHKNNSEYINFLKHVNVKESFGPVINKVGEMFIFKKGLFASTEMLVDGYMELYKNDILTKKVYDDAVLQKLLNENSITEKVTQQTVEQLLICKRISEKLTKHDFDYLQHYGIFKETLRYSDGYIYFSTQDKVHADLGDLKSKEVIFNKCLGGELASGHVVHAGFFVGSEKLYQFLENLDIKERKKIDMRGIRKINQLCNDQEINSLQRINARFVNSSMKVTLLGDVISDSLEDGKVVSGVGGQYNFVAMAHELQGARSIINCNSTYVKNGKIESNIIWKYSSVTVPRHLRDIIVTEYGIADCRSKTDSEVIKEILKIADSRFQDELLACAKRSGKLPNDYQIPKQYKFNFPETILNYLSTYSNKEIYNYYPFGCELSEEEIRLELIFKYLNSISKRQQFLLLLKGFFVSMHPYRTVLIRMRLDKPKNIKEFFYKLLLLGTCHVINDSLSEN